MGIIHRPRHTDTDWLAKGPIGQHVDAFKQYLTERGYAANTVASYMAGITHFARWAPTKRLRLDRIDEVSIAEFLDNHLPNCQCVAPVRHDRGDHSAALGHLLVVLRSLGAIPPATLSATAVDEELRCYDAYMDHARGLAPKSRSMALRIIGRLLTARFGSGAIDIAAIKPEQVRHFFAQEAVTKMGRYKAPDSLMRFLQTL